ncbi:MAG: DUF2484 family protein [Pseudoruegeria sp.]
MSISLFVACLWVCAVSVVAMLPMRFQFVPGLVLLLVSPVLLTYLAMEHGPWLCLAGLIAVLSMYRRPLSYYLRRLMRHKTQDLS